MHASARPTVEMADIVRRYSGPMLWGWKPRVSREQGQALLDIMTCRTEARGAHVFECDRCEHQEICYNSCLNRSCPKCRGAARGRWLEARREELLDAEYFHVVFTVPQEVAEIALQNRRVVYQILFRSSADTLLTLGRDPRHLGAEIGFFSLLHTWGQTLSHHPHIHCVVPGGGLAKDGSRWISCARGFFLPLPVLCPVYRGKFLDMLKRAYTKGELSFHGRLRQLRQPKEWDSLLSRLYEKDWIVHAKPPFGGPDRVLKYLARYTHRVAISNQRLVSMEGGKVRFSYKDYARGGRQRQMALPAKKFGSSAESVAEQWVPIPIWGPPLPRPQARSSGGRQAPCPSPPTSVPGGFARLGATDADGEGQGAWGRRCVSDSSRVAPHRRPPRTLSTSPRSAVGRGLAAILCQRKSLFNSDMEK
ncbi:IS91 family transposase [Planctomycetota bacterium]